MEKCVECGKTALLKTSFGKQILCSKCAGLINASSWNKRNFTSIDVKFLLFQDEALIKPAHLLHNICFPKLVFNKAVFPHSTHFSIFLPLFFL